MNCRHCRCAIEEITEGQWEHVCFKDHTHDCGRIHIHLAEPDKRIGSQEGEGA